MIKSLVKQSEIELPEHVVQELKTKIDMQIEKQVNLIYTQGRKLTETKYLFRQ